MNNDLISRRKHETGGLIMREILFRGKRKDNGEWETGSLLVERMNTSDQQVMIADKMTGYPTLVLPETVGQYTGIKDKSGKMVFEHDLVKAYDPLDEISFIGVVKYFDGSFYICDTDFCSYYRWIDYEVEVIGNIYDNPELGR